MPENVFCSKCGTQNPNTSQFCQKCGASLWPAASAQPAPVMTTGSAPQVAYAQPVAYAPAPASPYGGFWIRLLAHVIDHVVLSIVVTPLYFIMVFPRILPIIQDAERNGEPSPEMIGAIISTAITFAAIVLVGTWLYEALLTSSSWQGTIGKKLLRLKVTDEFGNSIGFGRATGRFFAKILSQMVLWIGYIMIGFTDRKRGLHDMLAGTLVMKY